MAGHSRPKDGVASLPYAIHVFPCGQDVDARDKRGHDEEWELDHAKRWLRSTDPPDTAARFVPLIF
jgi:hypothetical protein